jgi:hypothetical protein
MERSAAAWRCDGDIAPLRTMVATAMTPDPIAVDDPAREHIARLMLTLDAQLKMISLEVRLS